jgi:hypothetical protein
VVGEAVSDANTPKNPYAGYLQLVYDNNYGAEVAGSNRHNLKTGNQIPVAILAEVDRKIDDGNPYTGAFQFSDYVGTGGTAPTVAECITGAAGSERWNVAGESNNCGGASIF